MVYTWWVAAKSDTFLWCNSYLMYSLRYELNLGWTHYKNNENAKIIIAISVV